MREQGPEAVASASGQVPLSTLDANWLVPDRGSWGRYLLRKLEESASFLTPKSLYVAGVRVQNRDYASSELETYLSEWLAGACVESARFKVVDPKQALMALPAAQIRTRGLWLSAGASDPATQDFTAALVQAEGQLNGTAWISPQVIEIRANVYGPNGGQLAYASADVPRQLFPPSIFRPAAGPSDDSEASSDALVTRHGLKLDLTTNAGQRPEFIEGEKVRFVLRVNRDAYVYLFNINLKGEAVVLYPVDEQGDLAQKPPCGSVHPGGVPIVLPEDGCSYDIVVSEPFGKDRIWACASEVPLAIDPKLRGQWARGNGLIRNTRKASAVTGGGYAEAFVDVMTRSADKR